eukprot:Hpha_TRINITY_DN31921_c0_g1::TRINITY_DN31921_c0_g1_i1::g.21919::m.21919
MIVDGSVEVVVDRNADEPFGLRLTGALRLLGNEEESPAERAGLEEYIGWSLVTFDGWPVTNLSELREAVVKAGKKSRLVFNPPPPGQEVEPPVEPPGLERAMRTQYSPRPIPKGTEELTRMRAIIAIAKCTKTNHRGKTQQRVLLVGKLNLYLTCDGSSRKGHTMRRILQYGHIQRIHTAPYTPSGKVKKGEEQAKGLSILLSLQSPEHDMLLHFDDEEEARTVVDLIRAAKEAIVGGDTPVTEVESLKDLKKEADLKKKSLWKPPATIMDQMKKRPGRAGVQWLAGVRPDPPMPPPDVLEGIRECDAQEEVLDEMETELMTREAAVRRDE